MLVPKDKVEWDKDLLENSKNKLETAVKVSLAFQSHSSTSENTIDSIARTRFGRLENRLVVLFESQ